MPNDINGVNKFQGITPVSHVQFCWKPGFVTSDAILALHTLLDNTSK